MTGSHRRTDQDPVRSELKSVRWLLQIGFVAASLAVVGMSVYLLVTQSNYLAITTTALQGFLVVTYARQLALKVLGDRAPSPVVLADWIDDSALVIMWAAVLLASIGHIQGWMHGAYEYATNSILGLFAVAMPVYWWRGRRRVVLALTARSVAGRWPWSAGG